MKLAPLLLLPFAVTLCSCDGAAAGRVAAKISAKGKNGQPAKELDKAIFAFLHEADGDMWFGSDGNGAYRYDGKTLTHFTKRDGLPNGRIREIKQVRKSGELIFNTFDGVALFDGKRFRTLTPAKGEGWTLKPDDLWFKGALNKNSVFRYDGQTLHELQLPTVPQEKVYRAAYPSTPIDPYEVYNVYQDHKGHVWIGTGAMGVFRFDGKAVSWLYEDDLTNIPGGGSLGIRSTVQDRDGKFWFTNSRDRFSIKPEPKLRDGLALLDYTREKGLETDGNPYFMAAIEDGKGGLWMVAHERGVSHFDGKKLTRYPLMDGRKVITAFTIYRDRDGGVWVGTHEYGALKFNGKGFERFMGKR